MAKVDIEGIEGMLKSLYPPEYIPVSLAGKIQMFVELGEAGLLPSPWYKRVWRKLRWYAYAPHRWIHRNCDRC